MISFFENLARVREFVDAAASPRHRGAFRPFLTRRGRRVYGLATALLSAFALLPQSARGNSVWDAVEAGHLTWSGSGISTNWLAKGILS